jgi:ATP-dependent DNA helicase RecQ
MPVTDEEFLSVSGVGANKLEKYGEAFMRVIREYANTHKIESKPAAEPEDKSYMEKVKANYSVAYAPWTDEEISRLNDEYKSGMTVSQMSEIHERTKGAIQSRLKKEGLTE